MRGRIARHPRGQSARGVRAFCRARVWRTARRLRPPMFRDRRVTKCRMSGNPNRCAIFWLRRRTLLLGEKGTSASADRPVRDEVLVGSELRDFRCMARDVRPVPAREQALARCFLHRCKSTFEIVKRRECRHAERDTSRYRRPSRVGNTQERVDQIIGSCAREFSKPVFHLVEIDRFRRREDRRK